jgi:hypothetical protein
MPDNFAIPRTRRHGEIMPTPRPRVETAVARRGPHPGKGESLASRVRRAAASTLLNIIGTSIGRRRARGAGRLTCAALSDAKLARSGHEPSGSCSAAPSAPAVSPSRTSSCRRSWRRRRRRRSARAQAPGAGRPGPPSAHRPGQLSGGECQRAAWCEPDQQTEAAPRGRADGVPRPRKRRSLAQLLGNQPGRKGSRSTSPTPDLTDPRGQDRARDGKLAPR